MGWFSDMWWGGGTPQTDEGRRKYDESYRLHSKAEHLEREAKVWRGEARYRERKGIGGIADVLRKAERYERESKDAMRQSGYAARDAGRAEERYASDPRNKTAKRRGWF
jgi:hypothetical protein